MGKKSGQIILGLSVFLSSYATLTSAFTAPSGTAALAQAVNPTESLCQNCLRIGILPLKYDGNQKDIVLYAQGTQDSLIYTLSSIDHLVVIDRTKTEDLLKELAFQQSAYGDPKTQTRIGKILGVDYLYTGSMQSVGGKLRITLHRLHVETGQTRALAQVTGPVESLFELQDTIATEILNATDPARPVSDKDKQNLKRPKGTQSLRAYEAFQQGLAAQKEKQYPQALRHYSQALVIDSQYAFAYNNRGNVHASLGQHRQAIADFEQALKIDPHFAFAYYNRGNAYANQMNYRRAIADYDQAIAHRSHYADAYNARGHALHMGLKQYARAVDDYTKAIALQPKSVDFYFNRGTAYLQLKLHSLAVLDANRALHLSPYDANAYALRGNAYFYLGQEDEALKDWKQACQFGSVTTCNFLNDQKY